MGGSPLSRGGRLRADTSLGCCLSLYSVRYWLYRERSPSPIPVHSLFGETYEGTLCTARGDLGQCLSVAGDGRSQLHIVGMLYANVRLITEV